ncbi:MAG: hypothetical protein PHY14_01695 [Candidatus Gracilibacteria bacterium]|nr:hypothetical protein [Candidatus Gracilibacteria bacterium]
MPNHGESLRNSVNTIPEVPSISAQGADYFFETYNQNTIRTLTELMDATSQILKQHFSYPFIEGISGKNMGFFTEEDVEKMKLDQFTWNAIYNYSLRNKNSDIGLVREVLDIGPTIQGKENDARILLEDYLPMEGEGMFLDAQFQKEIGSSRKNLSAFQENTTGNCRILSSIAKTLIEYGSYKYKTGAIKVEYVHTQVSGQSHTFLKITSKNTSTIFDPTTLILGRSFGSI